MAGMIRYVDWDARKTAIFNRLSEKPHDAATLARRTGMPRSAVQRVLRLLREEGKVERCARWYGKNAGYGWIYYYSGEPAERGR
jgi:predicted transcriptional regulator